ncbi:hypothetical protein [Nocardia terpenica]|uniref:hypothetical protein n=1 Tax=Nocardia terpenica TaxID=455432 RepID=UPI000314F648|nr:hypothetical protein [Nocardia terpenica]NQE91014.1 hypothetical protein [Nocardia terpenica]
MTTKTRKQPAKPRKKPTNPITAPIGATTPRSTTGIRLSPSDQALLAKLTHPGETKADVIRRALHELERREWVLAAQEDAERIDASGEDLNDESDAW